MNDEGLDPIANLRDAWQRLDPPEPSADLSSSDPETLLTVRWMQSAWATVEAPAAPVLGRSPSGRRGRRFAVLAVAAAAAVIAIAVIRSPDPVRQKPSGGGPPRDAVAAAKEIRREPDRLLSHSETSSKPVADGEVRDEIALRSGPVRLVLVTATEVELSN